MRPLSWDSAVFHYMTENPWWQPCLAPSSCLYGGYFGCFLLQREWRLISWAPSSAVLTTLLFLWMVQHCRHLMRSSSRAVHRLGWWISVAWDQPVLSVPPENMLQICEKLMLNRPLISGFAFFPLGCFASCTTLRVKLSNMSMPLSHSQTSCWIASYRSAFFWLALYLEMWPKYLFSYFSLLILKTTPLWCCSSHSIIPH